jgi:hypothetical protein
MLAQVTESQSSKPYSSKLVALKLGLALAAESTLINQIRQVLLHHVLDHLDCRIEALLGCAGYAEVQRRILQG